MTIGIAKVCANGNNVYFRKIEGYIPSGLDARLIPRVDRLSDENLLDFKILKIC